MPKRSRLTATEEEEGTQEPSAPRSCACCRSRHNRCTGNGRDPCPQCRSLGKADQCFYPPRLKAGPRPGWVEEHKRRHLAMTEQLAAARREVQRLGAGALDETRRELDETRRELDETRRELDLLHVKASGIIECLQGALRRERQAALDDEDLLPDAAIDWGIMQSWADARGAF